jgi:hypothetical protein
MFLPKDVIINSYFDELGYRNNDIKYIKPHLER